MMVCCAILSLMVLHRLALQSESALLDQSMPPKQPLSLAVQDRQGINTTIFDFGTARFGQKLTHIFSVRNDNKTTIHIDRLQPACGCLSVLLVNGVNQQVLPTLAPGGTVQIEVQLDTTRLPYLVTTPLLSGSEIHKQILIYMEGQPIHAAAVLEMRGRITYGVTFDPPSLDFGTVDQAKGASHLVKVSYDADLFQDGKTRLSTTAEDSLKVLPLPPPSVVNVPIRHLDKSQVVRTYKVVVPTHAPISLLSGTLTVQGLAALTVPKGTHISRPLPAPTCQIAYTGQVVGKFSAQPGMVVFGLVRKTDLAGRLAATQEQQTRTNRWILLTTSTESPPTGYPHSRQEKTTRQPRKPSDFWQGARVKVDSPYFTACLLPANKAAALAQAKTKLSGTLPPLSASLQWHNSTACWLQVRLLPYAPSGKPLTGHVLITLADGERIRLPILALRE